MLDLNDKVAIVTGAARGQGLATAKLFARQGATVYALDVVACGKHQVATGRGSISYRYHDVTDEGAWVALVADLEQLHGRIDILVNNAAITDVTPVPEITKARLAQLHDINVAGPLLGMRAVLPAMRRAGRGAIVNISSVNGLRSMAGTAGYDATKWAVRGMTKSAALEFAAEGIRINSIHPGAIDTVMLNPEGGDTEALATALMLPMCRVGRPEEVAHATLFLVSDEASYVSGAELAVDGGWSCGTRFPGMDTYRADIEASGIAVPA